MQSTIRKIIGKILILDLIRIHEKYLLTRLLFLFYILIAFSPKIIIGKRIKIRQFREMKIWPEATKISQIAFNSDQIVVRPHRISIKIDKLKFVITFS